MKQYMIQKCGDCPDWEKIPSLSMEVYYKTPVPEVKAWAQVAWNEEYFFVRLRAVEPEIRAEETGPVGTPCEDSCLEFFFAPVEGDLRYFNIEYNPNACLYLGMGVNVQTLVRLLPEDIDELFYPEVKRYEGGWEVSYRVPFSFIRRFFPSFEAKTGNIIRANCYKCAEKTSKEHYMSWSRVEGEPLSFHRPQYFGYMELG